MEYVEKSGETMSVVKNELKLIGIFFVLVIITSILIVKLGANKYTAYYPVSSNESIDTNPVFIYRKSYRHYRIICALNSGFREFIMRDKT